MLTRLPSLKERIRMALSEDLSVDGDVTTRAVFEEDARGEAVVIAKEAGVVCGTGIFAAVFEEINGVEVKVIREDRSRVIAGDTIMELRGTLRALLAGERVALNFLQHLSGIATATAETVEAVGGRIAVCDTRKTAPLWRDLEKEAVLCGGGTNHRMGLYDMVMLKDTHADGAGSLREALKRVEPLRPRLQVAAEARTIEEVEAALEAKVDLIMLDNMEQELLLEAVKLIGRRIPTEVTGGVTHSMARELAGLGIDRISVGAITHSVKAMDYSMRLKIVK